MKIGYISIHRPSQNEDRWVFCPNSKKYTYEEYKKLVHKKQSIKDIVFVVGVSIKELMKLFIEKLDIVD